MFRSSKDFFIFKLFYNYILYMKENVTLEEDLLLCVLFDSHVLL